MCSIYYTEITMYTHCAGDSSEEVNASQTHVFIAGHPRTILSRLKWKSTTKALGKHQHFLSIWLPITSYYIGWLLTHPPPQLSSILITRWFKTCHHLKWLLRYFNNPCGVWNVSYKTKHSQAMPACVHKLQFLLPEGIASEKKAPHALQKRNVSISSVPYVLASMLSLKPR